jgi:hypothetical protein
VWHGVVEHRHTHHYLVLQAAVAAQADSKRKRSSSQMRRVSKVSLRAGPLQDGFRCRDNKHAPDAKRMRRTTPPQYPMPFNPFPSAIELTQQYLQQLSCQLDALKALPLSTLVQLRAPVVVLLGPSPLRPKEVYAVRFVAPGSGGGAQQGACAALCWGSPRSAMRRVRVSTDTSSPGRKRGPCCAGYVLDLAARPRAQLTAGSIASLQRSLLLRGAQGANIRLSSSRRLGRAPRSWRLRANGCCERSSCRAAQ